MQFNHDNMTGPFLAADLVTLAGRGWSASAAEEALVSHRIRRPGLTARAADALAEWAGLLHPVFADADVDRRCAAVNGLLDGGATRAYLTTHDALRPHLHFAADTDDVVARVKAVTAGGLALFVVESGASRLGVCAREGCPVAFVDTSRNGTRAYCSTTCGNYAAVRRHRASRSG